MRELRVAKQRKPSTRADRERELSGMSEAERLELFLAIDEVRHYLAAAPGSNAVVTAPKLHFAARLRGVKLPAEAFARAVDWLDRHQGR